MPELRRARPSDLPGLLALEQVCFQPHRRASRRSLLHSLDSPAQSVWVLDVEDGLAALMVLWHRPSAVRVYDLATRPDLQGQGLAGRLLAHAEAQARAEAAPRVVLEAGEQEPGLVDWYLRRGYRVREELPDYYGPGRGAVRMEKALE